MNDRRQRSRLVTGVLLLLLLLSMGCGKGGRPRVHGTVTYRNQPVGGRTLVLVSEGEAKDSFSHKISLQKDGTFSGEVPQPGTYKVVIEESLAAQEGKKPPSGEPIPPKYRSRDTTDQSWTIVEGDNEKDFVLQD